MFTAAETIECVAVPGVSVCVSNLFEELRIARIRERKGHFRDAGYPGLRGKMRDYGHFVSVPGGRERICRGCVSVMLRAGS